MIFAWAVREVESNEACLITLLGCSVLYPPEKQGRSALDDFVYALRWQQFNAAAGFPAPLSSAR